ncbi:MAG: nuclear transport factor 2 family protein [Rhodobacteraceae bacterium]|jgi:hypothetical protein|nr:nuclear transport factor 2 family protein [Paracoccaceae bacterium]
MGIAPRPAGEIADAEALHRLALAYSRAIDRRDFALLESLYWPEATDRHGAMFEGGVAAFLAFVGAALARYETTVHYVVHSAFALAGDRAEGEVHKVNYHRTPGPGATETITGSRSLDVCLRRGGEWRFLSREVVIDWVRTRPADPAAWADPAAQSPRGAAGADDPSYALPLLARAFV